MIRFVLFAFTFAAVNAYEMQKLFPNDPAAYDFFGHGVGIQNDKAIIGSFGDDSNNGAAYYFQNNVNNDVNDEWIQQQKIVANDGMNGDDFGRSVTMDNDRVLIGANGFNAGQGAVYVFGWNSTSSDWKEEAKLVANDGIRFDNFGGDFAVALQNDRAVIGAYYANSQTGSVYVFDYDSDTKEWSQTAKLTASDGQTHDWFGWSVDIFGDTIIVGTGAYGTKSAYIFKNNGTKWEEICILSATDATVEFGYSVALYGDYALVGPEDSSQNAAYFFRYNQSTNEWKQTQKVSGNGDFGWRVRLTEQTAFIGANYGRNDNNVRTGSVSIFRHNQNNGLWEETATIAPEQGQFEDGFSYGLQFHGNNVISGAWEDDTNGNRAGAAYVIRNHNSCNETRTEIIDQSYLINWEWTVCYTLSPTVDPTIDPTEEPTEPTVDPTIDPTVDPTVDPTIDPTEEPTVDPTIEPTVDPTVDPTTEPTVDPTIDPTVEPTVDPTVDPTVPSAPPTTAVPSTAAPSASPNCVCVCFDEADQSAHASMFPSMIISFLFFAIF